MSQISKINISKQGGPQLSNNSVEIIFKNNKVALLSVSLHSKRCRIFTYGTYGTDVMPIPTIMLDGEGALHLKRGGESELTEIEFTEFIGWEIWCCEVCRYTLSVCLINKNNKEENRYTIEEIAEYLSGWASGPYNKVQQISEGVLKNALNQLKDEQDGIETALKR
jgi:hypothetical protein